MSAKDLFHDCVRHSLEKDGWSITHDPLVLKWGTRDLLVDLGAEKLLAAEKSGRKIAVEIKSFVGPSPVEDLKNALGQFVLYHDVLERREPDRVLFLAVGEDVFHVVFEEPIGAILLENSRVRLLVFDPQKEVVVRWIP